MARKKRRPEGPALFASAEIDPAQSFALGTMDKARADLVRLGWTQEPSGAWRGPVPHDGRISTYQNERVRAGRTLAYDPRIPLPERMRRFRHDFPQAHDRMRALKEDGHGQT